ncbi:hypothetical protein CBS147333_7655 [Penicillium roqueforti]|nr:hypothetical protein CBS147333_7655 [Penicillium roqueforti]
MAQNLPSSDIKPWTRPAPKGYKFTNAHIVDVASGTIIENQTLIATDGKITYLGQESSAPTELETVDCQGKYLSLGLFDTQGGYARLTYLVAGTTLWSGLSYVFSNNAVKILSKEEIQKRIAQAAAKRL